MDEILIRKGLVPNLTSRMTERRRSKWKKVYIEIKKRSIILSVGAISYLDCKALINKGFVEVVFSKFKSRGYKLLIALYCGPTLQLISLPVYLFTTARKVRAFGLALCEIGAKVTSGEMEIINWGWIFVGLALFGEPVLIGDNYEELMIIQNHKEASAIEELLEILE
jgi:hypothetical protein